MFTDHTTRNSNQSSACIQDYS